VVELPLTAEEQTYWSAGVPNQQCTVGDSEAIDCGDSEANANTGFVKAQVWEQFAYASKLLRGGVVRSIALEFDFMDLHGDGVRTEQVVRTQARQCALPLARLIQSLKDAGLYDRTLIAVYTLDGSRRPAANSYGNGRQRPQLRLPRAGSGDRHAGRGAGHRLGRTRQAHLERGRVADRGRGAGDPARAAGPVRGGRGGGAAEVHAARLIRNSGSGSGSAPVPVPVPDPVPAPVPDPDPVPVPVPVPAPVPAPVPVPDLVWWRSWISVEW
jgi:hypothetical protein